MVALAGIFGTIYLVNKPSDVTGEKSITVEVIGSRGNTTDYMLETDAELWFRYHNPWKSYGIKY